jgi:hypothetical protein
MEGSSASPQSRQPSQTGICDAVSQFGEWVQQGLHVACFVVDIKPGLSRKPVELDGLAHGKFVDRASRLIPGANQSWILRNARFALHTRYRVGERDPGIHAGVENRSAPFQGF